MSKKNRKTAKQSKKQTSTGTEDTVKDQSAQKNVTQTQVNLMKFGLSKLPAFSKYWPLTSNLSYFSLFY